MHDLKNMGTGPSDSSRFLSSGRYSTTAATTPRARLTRTYLSQVEYVPDFRQDIASSWPSSIDDRAAARDWSWKPHFDLDTMSADMLRALMLKEQLHKGHIAMSRADEPSAGPLPSAAVSR
jgi:hypothetical protein